MRLGLIGDIHGNLVALDAVLAALGRDKVDRIVCLGDVAATGPQPGEALARLREVGCPVVLGNADAWLLDPPAAVPEEGDARRIAEIDGWCAARLSAADRAYLQSFAPAVAAALPDGTSLLACHGSPRSFDHQILPETPEAQLDRWLEGVTARIVAAGHSHRALVRRFRGLTLVNPGSVGLPFDPLPPATPTLNPPWAEYGVVEVTAGGAERITLGRVPFDVDRLRAAARRSGMPHAEWWSAGWRSR